MYTLALPLKARLHRRFLSRQLDAIFVALELQLQNRTCKQGAISVRFAAAISLGVSNMFETCCNLSATKIASSCRDKNRLCKRAFRERPGMLLMFDCAWLLQTKKKNK